VNLKFASVLVLVLAFASPACSVAATPDRISEVKALIDSRQIDRAEKIIVDEMMTSPRDADWITLLAEVRLGQNRTREALKLIDDANQIGGVTAPREMLISLAQSQAGHMDRAEVPLRKAIELDPDNATAHYFLSRLLYTDNRFDEAIVEGNKTVALLPTFVRAYENLGLCYEGKRMLDEAERNYRKAIDLESTSDAKTEWPMLDLAIMLVHENRQTEAKPLLMQALYINPDNLSARVQMGSLLEETGDLKGALDEFRLAIKSDASGLQPGLGAAYYKAARLCKKLGYTEEATEYFNKFTALNKNPLHKGP
jgi:tetratricopeptide (TPR) repeat protein